MRSSLKKIKILGIIIIIQFVRSCDSTIVAAGELFQCGGTNNFVALYSLPVIMLRV